jgi:hypothetical protein
MISHNGLEGLADKSCHCSKARASFSTVLPVGAAVRSDSQVYIPQVNTRQGIIKKAHLNCR